MMSTSDPKTQAEDQFAIWTFSGSTLDPYGTDASLVAAALAAANGFNGQGFEILTPTDGTYGQEFIIKTPEPPTKGSCSRLG
jgi:hypothetical protein